MGPTRGPRCHTSGGSTGDRPGPGGTTTRERRRGIVCIGGQIMASETPRPFLLAFGTPRKFPQGAPRQFRGPGGAGNYCHQIIGFSFVGNLRQAGSIPGAGATTGGTSSRMESKETTPAPRASWGLPDGTGPAWTCRTLPRWWACPYGSGAGGTFSRPVYRELSDNMAAGMELSNGEDMPAAQGETAIHAEKPATNTFTDSLGPWPRWPMFQRGTNTRTTPSECANHAPRREMSPDVRGPIGAKTRWWSDQPPARDRNNHNAGAPAWSAGPAAEGRTQTRGAPDARDHQESVLFVRDWPSAMTTSPAQPIQP